MQFSRYTRAACPSESANGTSPLTRFSAVRPFRSLELAGLSKLNSMSPTLASQAGNQSAQAPKANRGLDRLDRVVDVIPGEPRTGTPQTVHTRWTRAIPGAACGGKCHRIPRKEVIQPQLPLRLPCYDFTPITDPAFDGSLPCGLGHRLRAFPAFVV
jgi:hypothetical protein